MSRTLWQSRYLGWTGQQGKTSAPALPSPSRDPASLEEPPPHTLVSAPCVRGSATALGTVPTRHSRRPALLVVGLGQVLLAAVRCLYFFSRFPFTPRSREGFKITESDHKALLLGFCFPGPLAGSPPDPTRCFLVPSSRAKTFQVPLSPLRAPNPHPSKSAQPAALGRPYFTSRMEGFVSMMATMILSM